MGTRRPRRIMESLAKGCVSAVSAIAKSDNTVVARARSNAASKRPAFSWESARGWIVQYIKDISGMPSFGGAVASSSPATAEDVCERA